MNRVRLSALICLVYLNVVFSEINTTSTISSTTISTTTTSTEPKWYNGNYTTIQILSYVFGFTFVAFVVFGVFCCRK